MDKNSNSMGTKTKNNPLVFKVEEEKFERDNWTVARDSFTAKHTKDRHIEDLNLFLASRTTGSSVRRTCENLKAESDSKYRPGLGGILENIDALMNIGDLAIKSAPESVGLAWTGIRMCLNAVRGDWASFQLFSGACADIIGIMISCRVYGKMWGGETGLKDFQELHKQVADYIPTIYTEILEFSYEVHRYASRHSVFRFAQNVFKDMKSSFEGMINVIKDHDKNMRDYAKTASERLMKHLQEKTLENQDALKSEVVSLRETLEASLHANETIIRKAFAELEEERKETRQKTPYEKAQDEYQENMRLLDPAEDQYDILRENLDVIREPGTCQWILGLDTYKQWRDSPQSAMVWVSGAGGYGKSILMSTVIETLREDTVNNEAAVVQYFFCKTGINMTQNSRQILQNIVAQLYAGSLALPELLGKTNAVITRILRKRVDGTKTIDNFDFSLAYGGLLQAMEQNVFLIIDAVDECIDREEQKFLHSFRKIIDTTESRVKIMLCSRPESDIGIALSHVPNIKCESHNQGDIRKNITSEINRFPGWTVTDREYAVNSVVHKSGGQFKYVQIALEFLRKPLIRPYKAAIDRLPDGLTGSYINSWYAIEPDYRDLLKTALTWVLFTEGSVTVPEIIDAYSRTYDDEVGVKHEQAHDAATTRDKSNVQDDQNIATISNMNMNDGTNLHDKQILKAGGSFLAVSSSRLVDIRHLTVRDFFVAREQCSGLPNDEGHDVENPTEQGPSIEQKHASAVPWTISAKHAHLQILNTIVQNLASSAFQKEYILPHLSKDSDSYNLVQELLLREANQRSGVGTALKGHVDNDGGDDSGDDSVVETRERRTNGTGTKVDDVGIQPQKAIDPSSGRSSPTGSLELENNGNSSDDSDSDESLTSNASRYDYVESDDAAEVSTSIPLNEQRKRYRYELTHWMYHLKEAQNLWTLEEQQLDTRWKSIWKHLIDFMSQTTAFEAWQDVIFKDEKRAFDPRYIKGDYCAPMHVAAAFGLWSLARELIKKGFDVYERKSIRWWTVMNDSRKRMNRTPLDLAVRMDNMDSEMVKFLVEHSPQGALNDKASELVPFHQAILHDPSYEFVQFLRSHGAEVSVEDTEGWRALHAFSQSGTDPEVLQLLLDAKDSKEDINRPTHRRQDTPLHILVDRDNLPLDLLEAFLEAGADVNTDNEESKRPLSALAQKGKWRVVELLLSHKAEIHDIDDDGKTAFHEAAAKGNWETLEVLLKNGAKADAADASGRTPLLLACDNGNENTAMFLLQYFDNSLIEEVNKADQKGRTPLRQVAKHGNIKILETILTRFKHVSATAATLAIHAVDTEYGQNSMHKAAYHGRKAALEVLLSHGGDASIADQRSQTPFQICMKAWMKNGTEAREETLILLAERGLGSITDRTKLIFKAVTRDSAKLVDQIIIDGIDPQIKDPHGWTLLMLAQQYDQQAVSEVITKRSASSSMKPASWAPARSFVRLSKSGLKVEISPAAMFEVTAVSVNPVPAQGRKHYFEVKVISCPGRRMRRADGGAVGYSTVSKALPEGLGAIPAGDSYGWYASSLLGGPIGRKQLSEAYPEFEVGDTVGCALDLTVKTIFYTKNGERLPTAFRNVLGRFYPAVTMTSYEKWSFRANFGTDLKNNPFKWEGWTAWHAGV